MKLIALKKQRYPRRWDTGKEYKIGEEFEASDRDAKTLLAAQLAKEAPAEQRKALESAPAPVQTRAMAPEPDANQDASAGEGAGFRRRYKRRDLNPET